MTNYETTSFHIIRQWCEANGLWPGHKIGDKTRIAIGGADWLPPEPLELMDWDEWYEQFRRKQLKFVYDPMQGWYDLQLRHTKPD